MQLNDLPTVSVVIIVYNGAQYIKGAIESVLNQSFKNWEIVVVDDGSTDNTRDVLKQWIEECKINYFYQDNKGTSGAYNTGVRLAKGKYIKFLDCDDFLYPEQLKIQVNHLLDKPESVISVTNYELEFANKTKKTIESTLNKDNQLARFIEGNPCPGHTILITRKLIIEAGGFDEELINHEDTDLWIRIILKGGVFERVNYLGCCYRILDGSVSSEPNKVFRHSQQFYEKLNRILLQTINQLDNEARARLLAADIQILHKCLARKINPGTYLPITMQSTEVLYRMKKDSIRRLISKVIGIKNILQLQYLKACLIDKNYSKKMLGIEWREEKTYS